jgi:hypothetical protein
MLRGNGMKKFLTPVLVLVLILFTGLAINKQIKIKNLSQNIQNAEGALINGFYTKPNLDYNFILVEKEPTKENITALAKELSFTQSFFNSIMLMNKEKIEYSIWQKLQDAMRANECVNYILSLSSKESIQQADMEKLNKIKENFDSFYRNVGYDTSINGVVNINSLALSYLDFIKQIQTTK